MYVPMYQRDFTWGEDEVARLFEDVDFAAVLGGASDSFPRWRAEQVQVMALRVVANGRRPLIYTGSSTGSSDTTGVRAGS